MMIFSIFLISSISFTSVKALEISNDTTSSSGTDFYYDATNKELTLNGYNGKEIIAYTDLTIIVEGDNYINVDDTSKSIYNKLFDIYATGTLTVKGHGKLTINANVTKSSAYGIYLSDKSLSIEGNVTIDMNIIHLIKKNLI